ncbi:MAG TPA: hypothetical protein VFN94_08970, partial [Nitrospiria bacterium]|nr:hypothetical protein [Nitrospiria bacterium]
MNILLALVGLLSIGGVGWLWTSGFAGLDRPQRVGFAYGVGAVWIGVMMGVIPLVGLPLVPAVGWSVVGVPPVGWWVWRRLRGGVAAKDADRPIAAGRSGHAAAIRDAWWWGAAGFVGLLAAIVVARTVVKPIQAWDAWSTYATKAKAIYLSATVPRSMFETVTAPNYPLGVPLQEVWMSWFVGAWDDVAVKLLFPGYLVALLCLVYGELRVRWAARVAMGGTLFVGCLPFLLQHGQDGYTDLPLAYFVLGGAGALTRFLRHREGHALALGAIFAAGMVWSREDGVLVVVINGALLLYDGAWSFGIRSARTWRALLGYVAVPAAVWGGWTLVKALWAIPANLSLSIAGMAAHLDRLGGAVDALLTALFLEGNWLIL